MSLIGPGDEIVAAPGCGSPTTLLHSVAERSHEVPLTVLSGLQIDDAPFLDAADPQRFRLITWHVTGRLRTRVGDGIVEYLPARASDVPAMLARRGCAATLLRVSPPDRHGFHSLGPSASYPWHSARTTPIVIAEIDPDVPRTFGAWIHASELTATIDAESPMPVYTAAAPDATSTAIARRIGELLPERPVLQLGIGAIPEALTNDLARRDLGPLRFCGMATDTMVDLDVGGRLDRRHVYPDAAVLVAELMGGRRLMSFADGNPMVAVRGSDHSHRPAALRGLDPFVSINSAVEVDLGGQVNAESVRGRQIAGTGGSIDYGEAAAASPGGLRIVALASTTADRRHSRIVPAISADDAVSLPRSQADIVVTEHGVADLRGRTMGERRELLRELADPEFRDDLDDRAEELASQVERDLDSSAPPATAEHRTSTDRAEREADITEPT